MDSIAYLGDTIVQHLRLVCAFLVWKGMPPSALLRSRRLSRSKVGQQSALASRGMRACVLGHCNRRLLLLGVLCRVVRSGRSIWERSHRARRQAAERPSSWRWKGPSQEAMEEEVKDEGYRRIGVVVGSRKKVAVS
jgi:hypothetical protein